MQTNTNVNRTMETETISKNGVSSKNLMSRGNFLKMNFALFVACVMISGMLFSNCSSSKSPSEVTDKFLNALIKKDYKTAATYCYIGTNYTDEQKAEMLKNNTTAILGKYKIQDEQISADGNEAIVTFNITATTGVQLPCHSGAGDFWAHFCSGLCGCSESERETKTYENEKMKLIKTETNGWKIRLR